jgi:hypothetical protein
VYSTGHIQITTEGFSYIEQVNIGYKGYFDDSCWGPDLYTRLGTLPMDNYPVTAPIPHKREAVIHYQLKDFYNNWYSCLLTKQTWQCASLPLIFDDCGWSGGVILHYIHMLLKMHEIVTIGMLIQDQFVDLIV